MPNRFDRRGRGPHRPSEGATPPTGRQWARAKLDLTKHLKPDDPESTVFELRKSLTANGRTWTQTLWLNLAQLRAVARDHAE